MRPRGSLYQKIFVWFALNLVLMGLVLLLVGGWLLFGKADGLFSPQIFRKNINTTVRLAAANLQYKPMCQWADVLAGCGQEYGLEFQYQVLDADDGPPPGYAIPAAVLQAAMRIPKPPYSLCPDPEAGDPQYSTPALDMEAGIPPAQRVIFMRAGEPVRYWFGRPIFVADDAHRLHYVLLAAASSSITGNGQFFNVEGVISLMLGVLGLSFLWWWPFVRHITRPLKAMTETAERIAAGHYTDHSAQSAGRRVAGLTTRRDEIGRLAQAVSIMAEQVMRQVHGQRRFIRHIAHELGSPLARIKLGLAVLESRLDGDAQNRIGQVSLEVEQLSSLVEDVLTYLRAGAESTPPQMQAVALCPLLHYVAGREAQGLDVHIIVDEGLDIYADADFLRRALANVLRNAVRYAGSCGPVVMEGRRLGSQIVVDVCDSGPGVAEHELAHIMEPFYRGAAATAYPGGSGLGLSIVKHCVEACGGSVTCQNMKPAGFAVSMRFPVSGPKAG